MIWPDVSPVYVADPGHDPVAVPDPGVVPALPSCMRELWKPSTSEICAARWSVARAVGSAHDAAADRRHTCETVGGRTALAMTSYSDKRSALQDFAMIIPGGGDAGRMTAQMFIPSDYQPYTAGRLALHDGGRQEVQRRGLTSGRAGRRRHPGELQAARWLHRLGELLL